MEDTQCYEYISIIDDDRFVYIKIKMIMNMIIIIIMLIFNIIFL